MLSRKRCWDASHTATRSLEETIWAPGRVIALAHSASRRHQSWSTDPGTESHCCLVTSGRLHWAFEQCSVILRGDGDAFSRLANWSRLTAAESPRRAIDGLRLQDRSSRTKGLPVRAGWTVAGRLSGVRGWAEFFAAARHMAEQNHYRWHLLRWSLRVFPQQVPAYVIQRLLQEKLQEYVPCQQDDQIK